MAVAKSVSIPDDKLYLIEEINSLAAATEGNWSSVVVLLISEALERRQELNEQHTTQQAAIAAALERIERQIARLQVIGIAQDDDGRDAADAIDEIKQALF